MRYKHDEIRDYFIDVLDLNPSPQIIYKLIKITDWDIDNVLGKKSNFFIAFTVEGADIIPNVYGLSIYGFKVGNILIKPVYTTKDIRDNEYWFEVLNYIASFNIPVFEILQDTKDYFYDNDNKKTDEYNKLLTTNIVDILLR